MRKIKAIVAACALAVAGTAMAEGYNMASISYNNNHFGFNKDAQDEFDSKGKSLNGFGLNYIHGFGITESLPMYIEAGASINFGFHSKKFGKEYSEYDDAWYQEKEAMQNFNLTIPVNFTYHFKVWEEKLTIAPYTGFNFKINMATRFKDSCDSNDPDYKEDGKWYSAFDKGEDAMDGKDYTWNVFQMGWQIGCNVKYDRYFLGLEYCWDMIPAYRHDFSDEFENWTPAVNTGMFKLAVGFVF
ncbi:MAG: PorT family protein [Muribaculaceae bacterium]|nr:PorT family protein [Muribaculaceae bacterium]